MGTKLQIHKQWPTCTKTQAEHNLDQALYEDNQPYVSQPRGRGRGRGSSQHPYTSHLDYMENQHTLYQTQHAVNNFNRPMMLESLEEFPHLPSSKTSTPEGQTGTQPLVGMHQMPQTVGVGHLGVPVDSHSQNPPVLENNTVKPKSQPDA